MIKIIKYIINTTINGFMYIINTICSGIYTYLIAFFRLLNTIFKNKFDKPLNKLSGRQKPAAILLVVIYIFSFTALFNILYTPKDTEVSHNKLLSDNIKKIEEKEEKKESPKTGGIDNNLFRKFGKMRLSEVNFEDLKKQNSDVVAWISADGTNINYPVVQSADNDFYLTHTFTKDFNNNGWVFMDFRNDAGLDKNTIVYGHNLLNKTGLGSMSNFFTKNWKNTSTRTIIMLTENKEYVYKVFSVYVSPPVVSYLQVDFINDEEYLKWITDLKNKDTMGLNEEVSGSDKIITFSTCTEDNKGRKVMHARLISEKDR